MRRVTDFLLRNWPLRLGAILLATVLYTGIVLGQNVRTWSGQVPVDPIRPPAGATLLSDLAPVTQIRYRAPLDIGVLSPDSFRATVDLSRVSATPGGDAINVPVTVVALDARIQVVDFTPHDVAVQLDPVQVREMPITVSLGSVADGLTLGPPQVDPGMVTLRGASSRVDQVSQVVARVSIDASALNVDREVELIAVDGNGNQVGNVEIDPERARVRIAVARELANRSLPVVPILTGVPAVGYRISAIRVEPLVVTLSGEASIVAGLDSAPTQPINVQGRSTDLEANVSLNLPAGVSVNGSDQIKVVLTIVQDTGTRSFQVAVQPASGPSVSFPPTVVTVVLSGPLSLLNSLSATQISATVDPAGPVPMPVTVDPPAGLQVVSVTPAAITPPTPDASATP